MFTIYGDETEGDCFNVILTCEKYDIKFDFITIDPDKDKASALLQEYNAEKYPLILFLGRNIGGYEDFCNEVRNIIRDR